MKKNMFYDKDFRNKIRQLDKESLKQIMGSHLTDAQVKVLVNTKDTSYFIVPAETSILDLELQSAQITAGNGTQGSVASAGCFGCASSTVSTGGTASSVALWI